MALDGTDADDELGCDLGIAAAGGRHRDDLALSGAQIVDRLRVAPYDGVALGLHEIAYLSSERRPRRLVGEDDVVPCLERDEPSVGDPGRDVRRMLERRCAVAPGMEDERRHPDGREKIHDIDRLAGDPARDGVLRGGRQTLEIVEPAHLPLGGVGDEGRRENAAEGALRPCPAGADEGSERVLRDRIVDRAEAASRDRAI